MWSRAAPAFDVPSKWDVVEVDVDEPREREVPVRLESCWPRLVTRNIANVSTKTSRLCYCRQPKCRKALWSSACHESTNRYVSLNAMTLS
jgi:hypothetical protein